MPPPRLWSTMSSEICETGSFPPDGGVGDLAWQLFDTKGAFEKWLRLTTAPPVEWQAHQPDAVKSEPIKLDHEGAKCDVTFAGVLRVEGLLKGSISSPNGTLVMSEQGRIEADIDVRVAVINGYMEGNIWARDHVVLDRNARVTGNIHTPFLAVRGGAQFEGNSFLIEQNQKEIESKISVGTANRAIARFAGP
jgi:cytoskeletal protein CcmA (bactofilin family)